MKNVLSFGISIKESGKHILQGFSLYSEHLFKSKRSISA